MAPNVADGPEGTLALAKSASKGEDAPSELSAVVDELLESLSAKFGRVSTEIFTKMDEMSRRLDNLEAALQPNTEKSASPTKS